MTGIRPNFPPTFGSSLPPSAPPISNPAAKLAQAEVEYFNEGAITRNFSGIAETILHAPDQIKKYLKTKLYTTTENQQMLSTTQRLSNSIVNGASWFFTKLVDYDYKEFPALGKLKISEPPMGALILLLFPFTIGPRLYRAAKRDSREVGDVLRRDVTAITIFLFALKPLINAMNKVAEKVWKIDLVNKETGKVFQYEQLGRNYLIDNEKTLIALIQKNQEVALLKAASQLTDNGLLKLSQGEHAGLSHAIIEFNRKLAELVPLVKEQSSKAEGVAKEAFAQLAKMDSLREAFVKAASEGSSAKLVGLAKGLPKFNEFLVRYAKTRRLPIDVAAFVAVCVGIGWFPVWFNDRWNRKKFAEQMAAKRAAEAVNFDPAITFQSLKQSSKLNQSFFGA